jgi:signal peptidase I
MMSRLKALFSSKLVTSATLACAFVYAGANYLTYSYPTYEVGGYSMMPNVTSNQSITGARHFSEVVRHDVFFIDHTMIDQSYTKTQPFDHLKRIVGIPGDTLTFDLRDGGLVKINGTALTTKRAKHIQSFTLDGKQELSGAHIFNAAYTLVHNDVSYDVYQPLIAAAATDPVTQKLVTLSMDYPWLKAQQEGSTPYVTVSVPDEHYFALSDNRIMGTDSRSFGFIHGDALIAKKLK